VLCWPLEEVASIAKSDDEPAKCRLFFLQHRHFRRCLIAHQEREGKAG
jgi:hypothetical protein